MYAILYMCVTINSGVSCELIKSYAYMEDCTKVAVVNAELAKKNNRESALGYADFFCIYR